MVLGFFLMQQCQIKRSVKRPIVGFFKKKASPALVFYPASRTSGLVTDFLNCQHVLIGLQDSLCFLWSSFSRIVENVLPAAAFGPKKNWSLIYECQNISFFISYIFLNVQTPIYDLQANRRIYILSNTTNTQYTYVF